VNAEQLTPRPLIGKDGLSAKLLRMAFASEKSMRPRSRNFKRQVVSLATAVATVTIYLSFIEHRWAIYVALSVGYTIILFGLAWSDNKMRLFFRDNSRSLSEVVRLHLTYLLMLMAWIWLTQYSRPSLPSWITYEGDHHESWFLIFVLLGIITIWWLEQSRLTAKPKPNPFSPNSGRYK
jgi:hypothetical protein